MGNFLANPITEKNTLSGEENGIKYGYSEMQGWRASMEDAHSAYVPLEGFPEYSVFAVYDGHGGSLVAKKAEGMIVNAIQSKLKAFSSSTISPEKLGELLTEVFLEVDEEIRRIPEISSGEDHSGCTAVLALVTATHIIVANSGT